MQAHKRVDQLVEVEGIKTDTSPNKLSLSDDFGYISQTIKLLFPSFIKATPLKRKN